MNALLSDSDSDSAAEWERLRPTIDDAIQELGDRDREAVLLRFFENRPFAEIGAVLRVSEDAARMRVERALDKLRSAFARRGVTSTGAALAAILASQAGAAAPAGLAGSITSAALAGVGAGATAAGVGLFLMSKMTTTLLAGAVLVAGGAALYQWTQAQRAETELAALRLERDGLRNQFAAEQQSSRRSAQEASALQAQADALQMPPSSADSAAAPAAAPAPPPPLAQLSSDEVALLHRSSMNKAIVNNLRVIYAARDQFQRDHGRAPASLDELIGEGKSIPALVAVNGEDYSALSLVPGQPLAIADHEGTTVAYDPSTPPPTQELTPAMQRARDLSNQLKPAVEKAVEAFRAANNGAMPPNPAALVPYFATPQESTDFTNLLSITGGAR